MKNSLVVFIYMFSISSGIAQTTGIVECDGRSGISAWEKPESIVVVEHLACGRKLPVVGTEKGFVKVQLKSSLFAYVSADHIRLMEPAPGSETITPQSGDRGDSASQLSPGMAPQTKLSRQESGITKLPLVQRRRDTLLKPGLEFGLDSSYIKYEEPDFMKEEGVTLSLYGNYTLRPSDFMVRFEGRVGFAGMHYSSPLSGETKKIRDYIVEARGLAGYSFGVSDRWYLTPYAGFGYRFLFDGLGGKVTTAGHLGYDRRSNYLYTPIGLESANFLKHSWALVATIEYDLFWKGRQESDLGVLFGGSPTIINDQEGGWGLRGSGKFVKEMGRVDLAFGPYFKYWNIEDSEWAYLSHEGEELAFMEPANTSVEIGAMFGMVF